MELKEQFHGELNHLSFTLVKLVSLCADIAVFLQHVVRASVESSSESLQCPHFYTISNE